MANMSLLNTEEKVVQMCDIINLMDARIKELEAEVTRLKADDNTLAFGGDVGNLKDFEGLPPLPDAELPVPLKEVKKEEPKKEEVKKEEVKKAKKGKLTQEEMIELSERPYNPLMCRRRLWNGGYGCQCGKAVYENGLCKVDNDKLYHDEKKKEEWASKDTFPEGYYDEEKSGEDLITGKWKGWKGMEKPKKAKKASVKKASVKKVPAKKAPVKKVVEEVEAPLQVMAEPVVEEQVIEPPVEPKAECGYELEEELGDELDEYDDFEYQGVLYQVRGGVLYTVNWEEIGTVEGQVAIFKDEEARQAHDEHPDKDDE